MTDQETLDRARLLFVGDTQGDRLARELIGVAERAAKKAALWEEIAAQKENMIRLAFSAAEKVKPPR